MSVPASCNANNCNSGRHRRPQRLRNLRAVRAYRAASPCTAFPSPRKLRACEGFPCMVAGRGPVPDRTWPPLKSLSRPLPPAETPATARTNVEPLDRGWLALDVVERARTGVSPAASSSSSMRSSWLYFATRSLAAGRAVLIWPVLHATDRSAMVVSSVSPERWLMTQA